MKRLREELATGDDALIALDRARRKRERAEADEQAAVAGARAAGASWTRIGAVYGLTKQGAQQRFKQVRDGAAPADPVA